MVRVSLPAPAVRFGIEIEFTISIDSGLPNSRSSNPPLIPEMFIESGLAGVSSVSLLPTVIASYCSPVSTSVAPSIVWMLMESSPSNVLR